MAGSLAWVSLAAQGGSDHWRGQMLDTVMLVMGCAFFAVAVLYTVGCDRI